LADNQSIQTVLPINLVAPFFVFNPALPFWLIQHFRTQPVGGKLNQYQALCLYFCLFMEKVTKALKQPVRLLIVDNYFFSV